MSAKYNTFEFSTRTGRITGPFVVTYVSEPDVVAYDLSVQGAHGMPLSPGLFIPSFTTFEVWRPNTSIASPPLVISGHLAEDSSHWPYIEDSLAHPYNPAVDAACRRRAMEQREAE